jgi:hypothetical protein
MQALILRGDLRSSGFGANDGWSLLPAAVRRCRGNSTFLIKKVLYPLAQASLLRALAMAVILRPLEATSNLDLLKALKVNNFIINY